MKFLGHNQYRSTNPRPGLLFYVEFTHVFDQYGWYFDTTVGLLEVLYERYKYAWRRYSSRVERMSITEFAFGVFVTDIETAALEIMEI